MKGDVKMCEDDALNCCENDMVAFLVICIGAACIENKSFIVEREVIYENKETNYRIGSIDFYVSFGVCFC